MDMTINYPLMVKTLLGKFQTQQKLLKFQVFNCSITKNLFETSVSLYYTSWFTFSLFSCHKISTLVFRSMFVIYITLVIALSWSGENWTVAGFYPTNIRLLPHLVGKKPDFIFLYFLPNNWAIAFFFSVLKDLGNTRIFPERQILLELNGAESLKVYINCLLFTPLDYNEKQKFSKIKFFLTQQDNYINQKILGMGE